MEITKLPITDNLGISISLSDLILFITFIAICWYSWETRKMRKEIVSQTKIQSTPFISVFENGEWFSPPYEWCIRNDGEGTAIQIHFQVVGDYEKALPTFKQIQTLPKGERETLEIESGHPFGDVMFEKYRRDRILLKLEYKNILNETYHADLVFDNGVFLIKKLWKQT
jgi:hypothetical protein